MRATTAGLMVATTLLALAACGEARAQSDPGNSVDVRVQTVVATYTHKGMDKNLAGTPVGHRLKMIFDYTSYQLVKRNEEHTVFGNAVAFNLPCGRILHVTPIALDGDMIAMDLVLFEGAHSLMRLQLKMPNHGALILVGPREPRETYITTIAPETVELEVPQEPGFSGRPAPAEDLPPSPLPVGPQP
jgi:hypothetical protein